MRLLTFSERLSKSEAVIFFISAVEEGITRKAIVVTGDKCGY
jgi:hypothetical protein